MEGEDETKFVPDYDEGEITSSSDSDTESDSCTSDNTAGGATVPSKKPSTEGTLKSVVVVPDNKKPLCNLRTYEKEGVTFVIPPTHVDWKANRQTRCPAESCPTKIVSTRHFVRHWQRTHEAKSEGRVCPMCTTIVKDMSHHIKTQHKLSGKKLAEKMGEVSKQTKMIYNRAYFPPGPFRLDTGTKTTVKRPASDIGSTQAEGQSKRICLESTPVRTPALDQKPMITEQEIVDSFVGGYSGPAAVLVQTEKENKKSTGHQSNVPLQDALTKQINCKLISFKGKPYNFQSGVKFQTLPGCHGAALIRAQDLEGTKITELIQESWKSFCGSVRAVADREEKKFSSTNSNICAMKGVEDTLRSIRLKLQEATAHQHHDFQSFCTDITTKTSRYLQFVSNLTAAREEDLRKRLEESNCQSKLEQEKNQANEQTIQSLRQQLASVEEPRGSQTGVTTHNKMSDQRLLDSLRLDLEEAEHRIQTLEARSASCKCGSDEHTKLDQAMTIEFLGVSTPLTLPFGAEAGTAVLCLERDIQAYCIATAFDLSSKDMEAWVNNIPSKEKISINRALRISRTKEIRTLCLSRTGTEEEKILNFIRMLRENKGLVIY